MNMVGRLLSMRMRVCKQVFLSFILIWMFEGVFTQRKGKFPFHDEGNLDTGRKETYPNPLLEVCSKCTELYQTSNREYRRSSNNRLFCLRTLQINACMQNLEKENPECVDVTYFALKTGLRIQMLQRNCTSMKLTTDHLQELPKTRNRQKQRQKCKFKPQLSPASQVHCGMFGDPHLRTFTDKRQTCVVAGAWSLLDNEHLAVQVTNEPLQSTNSPVATATSKVTVMFKEKTNTKCLQQKIYEAHSRSLPPHFKDGTTFTGPNGCRVQIFNDAASNQTELRACHINTTIVIRRVGKYLTLNIGMPAELLSSTTGLCHVGCPVTEMVDYITFFRNRMNEVPGSRTGMGMSKEAAMFECEKANLTDFYYDSCVFDLMTTGDQMFSVAARTALNDAKRMDPKLRLRRENSVVYRVERSPSLITDDSSNSSELSSRKLRRWHLLYLLMLISSALILSAR